jgi:signal peptidase I
MLKRLGGFFLDILEVDVLAFALFLFFYLLVFQPHKIDGRSMEPNFFDKEYLLTDKTKYKILREPPARGEVVVFTPPLERDKEFIKRIIGLPGERVGISGGKVYINGKELKEDYLPAATVTSGAFFLQDGQEVTVPEGQFFVLGDNRQNSSDSRYWGFVPAKDIIGRAWVVYWPINKARTLTKYSYNL